MSNQTASPLMSVVGTPERSGILLGVFAVLVHQFLYAYDIALLGVSFVTVGFLLALWADDWWPAIGRSLVIVGGFALLVTWLIAFV